MKLDRSYLKERNDGKVSWGMGYLIPNFVNFLLINICYQRFIIIFKANIVIRQ